VKTSRIDSRTRAGCSIAPPRPSSARVGRIVVGSVVTALAALLVGLSVSPALAAGTWRVFLYGNEVRGLVARGEEVWAATTGGLVRLSPDGTMSQWNRAAQELLSDSVSTVAVDGAAHVWAGTERAGISVFEPERTLWTPFTSLSQPIPGDRIERLRFAGPASAETLLVGAAQGYALLVNGELRQACLEGIDICGLPSYEVRDLIGMGGELWLATANGAVSRSPDGAWDPRDEGLGTARPRRFARADSLYLATYPSTGGTLWAWRNGRWGRAGDASLPPWFVPVDLLAVGDTLYAAGTGGVYRRVHGAWSPAGDLTPFAPAPNDTVTVNGLARTASGRLYAGASHPLERRDGIWERHGAGWVQHRLDGPSLMSAYTSITFDAQGALWISSVKRRVSPLVTRYRDGQWTLFRGNENGRSNAWTYRMLDTPGGLWLAHCCGHREVADSYLMERIESGDRFQTWPVFNAFDLAPDSQGRLWIATSGLGVIDASGLYRLDPRTFPPDAASLLQVTVATPGAQLKSDMLNTVAVDGDNIWIGYPDDGASRWDLGADRQPLTSDDRWSHYTEAAERNALIGNRVKRIVPGPDGRIWIGTTAGLTIFDDPKLINIGADGRLPTAEVNDVIPLADGGAWVATKGGGLTRMAPRSLGGFTYQVYGPPDLPNPNIAAMTVAPDGRTLWLATDRGLASFLPPESADTLQASAVGAQPNPYNPWCAGADGVRLIGAGSNVRGTVVDLSGKVLAEFPAADRGTQDAALPVWNGKDRSGRLVAPGLYWIRVQTARGVRSVGVAVVDGRCPQ
jgi:ligand-binding sensor domain-containing protein